MQHPKENPREKAREYGIDVSLIDYNLSLSYEKRLEQHQSALELMEEMEKASRKHHEKFKRSSQNSPRK